MELFPLFGFVEVKNILIIFHLIGVAAGLGGAFVADLMFMKTMRDGMISSEEFSFLTLGGGIVWFGLGLIVLSGAGMFFLDTAKYIESTKFLSKMTVVGVLSLNAIVFHAIHIPIMKKTIGKRFAVSKEFMKNQNLLIISGVVSIFSWVSALVLATFSSIPLSYLTIISIYFAILTASVLFGISIKDHILPKD